MRKPPSTRNLLMTAAALGLVGLSLAACQKQHRSDVVVGGHTLVVADRLTCPDQVGHLTKRSASADGQSCVYGANADVEITLSRVTGGPAATLVKGIEANLAAIVPPPEMSADGRDSGNVTADDDKSDRRDDHADINLPGLHIKGDGDKAQVNLPGIHIDARGEQAHITTSIGALKNATIDARDGAALIQSDMTDGGNTNRMWMSVTDNPGPSGYRSVGYAAKGPNSGPLIVAQMKSRQEHQHDPSESFRLEDVRRLIDMNLK